MNTINKRSKGTTWLLAILTTLIGALFAMSGVMKLMQPPEVVQSFSRAGIPHAAILPLGALELTCLLLYLVPRTTVLGSLLLTGYLGGAILTNLVLGSSVVIPLCLGVAVWGGAWLRVAELRTLLPVRRAVGANPGGEAPATYATMNALA